MDETTLHKALEQKEKALDLILAIDEVRDAARDPAVMLSDIVRVLAASFRTELGMLALVDLETDALELKVVYDRSEGPGSVESIARSLAVGALEMNEILFRQVGQDTRRDVLHLVAVPILMDTLRLGVLILGRKSAAFDKGEVELLTLAESQLDSAVVQAHAAYAIQQRNKELETVYRVDRIRDQGLGFDEMLSAVLHELCTVLDAEVGFILLYDQVGRRLELRASTHDDLFDLTSHREMVRKTADEALLKGDLIRKNDLEGGLGAILCIPLILQEEVIGVFGAANREGGRGFTAGDCRLLRAVASQIDTAIFENLERRRLRQVLSRSVDPQVMERILASPSEALLSGERMMITVLYADLRSSTQLAEQTVPEQFVAFINDYLKQMTKVILGHGGTLDKFTGDGVMALFGAPFPHADHALRSVRAAWEMRAVHEQIVRAWKAEGLDAPLAGIGIATGELIAGELGSAQRTVYTVIGRAANLGSRLCDVAEGGQVLLAPATYDLVAEFVEAVPIRGLYLKGVEGESAGYALSRLVA